MSRRPDGAPADSWWAKPLTREAFRRALVDELPRMQGSRFGCMQSLTTGGTAPPMGKKRRESLAQEEE